MRSARIVFFLRLLSMFPDATVLLAAECLKLRRIRLLNSCYPVVRALLVYCICPTSDRMEAGLPVSTHLRLLSNVLRNSTFAALLFPEVISRWLIALDKLVLGDCFDISDWQLGIQISRHISGLAVHRCSDIRLTIVNCLVRTTSRLFSWLRLSTLVRGVSDDHETVREASLKVAMRDECISAAKNARCRVFVRQTCSQCFMTIVSTHSGPPLPYHARYTLFQHRSSHENNTFPSWSSSKILAFPRMLMMVLQPWRWTLWRHSFTTN